MLIDTMPGQMGGRETTDNSSGVHCVPNARDDDIIVNEHEDIRRLEVLVHQAVRMNVSQAIGNLRIGGNTTTGLVQLVQPGT